MQDSSDYKLENREVKLLTTPRIRINWGLIIVLVVLVSAGIAFVFDKNESQAKKDERSKKAADAFEYLDTEESRLLKSGAILPPGTGRIVPSNQHLWIQSAATTGTIRYINESAEVINKDDVLIKIENKELMLMIKQAELKVESVIENLKFLETQKSGPENKLLVAKINQAQIECDKIEEKIKLSIPFEGVTISSLEMNNLIKQKEIAQQHLNIQKEKLTDFTELTNKAIKAAQKDLILYQSKLTNLYDLSSQLVIKAPIEGRILETQVKNGQKVMAGDTLLTFYDPSHINVQLAMPYANFPYFKIGKPARILLESQPNKSYNGSVIKIKPLNNQTRNNFEVIIKFNNPDERVLIGCTARIEFQEEKK